MHKYKGSGWALGLDLFFRDGLYFYFYLPIFFSFIYTTGFDLRINKDITNKFVSI